jgi:hypothetical protein
VRDGIKIPAVALGLLTATLVLLAAGCAASSGNSVSGNSVQGCADYGAQAIEHHVTVTRTPPPCRGLSAAQINQAVGMAVIRVAGGARKAVWRRRAAGAARYLSGLIRAIHAPPGAQPAEAASPGAAGGSGPLGGRNAGMDAAALIAWLVTAGSGLSVLGNWMSHGGTLRPRTAGTGTATGTATAKATAKATGSPPSVIFAHFGLALTGLVIWIAYLVAGWNALAWAAVAVLLPVAGFGMAALAVGLPASDAPATVGLGGGAGGVAVLPARGVKRNLSPLIVVAHGALAVTTMTLVLLAAIGV